MSLTVPIYAASSDYTVTVSTDAENIKRGDIVTVNVTVNGAQFCAVDAELSYDTNSFEYVSSMSGWSDNGEGKLRLVNVKGSDGYWDDGKVIGTFKFAVKDEAPAGESAFAIGEDRDVFIIGDWAEGTRLKYLPIKNAAGQSPTHSRPIPKLGSSLSASLPVTAQSICSRFWTALEFRSTDKQKVNIIAKR